MSLILFLITLISFIVGIIAMIYTISNPFTDPFILEVFISNPNHANALIGFKLTNNTQHSLKTDIIITPIVHDKKYGTIPYDKVLNPGEEYVEPEIKGEYGKIRDIDHKHNLNADSYKNNKQLLKFELQARFKNSRFKVLKIHDSTKITTAYDNITRTFRRVE